MISTSTKVYWSMHNNDTESSANSEHDQIEVLSTQVIHLEIPRDPQISTEQKRKLRFRHSNSEQERKKISKAVAIVFACLLIISFILIGTSLMMSSNIDEIVRNSNKLLQKQHKKGKQYDPSGNYSNATAS